MNTLCPDHWHCDPKLAAHDCYKVDRSGPCPTCGEKSTVRPKFKDLSHRQRLFVMGNLERFFDTFAAGDGDPEQRQAFLKEVDDAEKIKDGCFFDCERLGPHAECPQHKFYGWSNKAGLIYNPSKGE